jgi:hypothetical protein
MSFFAAYKHHRDRFEVFPADEPPPIYFWRPCAVCGALGPYVCDWVAIGSRPVKVCDLVVGDYIHRKSRPERKAQVVSIQVDAFRRNLRLRLVKLKVLSGKIRLMMFSWDKESVCWTLRPGPCGLAVCELHVRELGDRRHVCEGHWDAWDHAPLAQHELTGPVAASATRQG